MFINVCCQFTAQVGNTNQGYNGNNGNTGYNNNPNNGNNQFTAQVGNTNQGYQGNINSYNGNNGNNANNQAVFQNDANIQVRQQYAPQNNYPNGKQESLQQISIFALCNF